MDAVSSHPPNNDKVLEVYSVVITLHKAEITVSYHSRGGSELPGTRHRVSTYQRVQGRQHAADIQRPLRAVHGRTGTVHQCHKTLPEQTRRTAPAQADWSATAFLCVDINVHSLTSTRKGRYNIAIFCAMTGRKRHKQLQID